jgi:hypothetical protein
MSATLTAVSLSFATIALAATIPLTFACGSMGGADLEFADWLLPVPEGTPVKEYAPVAVEERDPDAVRLVEDLVIGGDPYDEQTLFYGAGAIVASPAGDIFVIDRGNNRIQMFGPDGAYKKTLGKQGQGPGEFAGLSYMIISEGRLVVYDTRNRRYSYWTLDGDHIADHVPTQQASLLSMTALADGSFVSMFTERDEDRTGRRVVVRRSTDGTELSRLFEMPLPPPPDFNVRDYRQMLQDSIRSFDDPRLSLTAGSGEVVYLTPVQEYQVFALSDAGDMLWALRVAWPRPPYPELTKDRMVESFAEAFSERFEEPLTAADFEWPVHDSGLRTLRTDASGRLYVFPAVERVSEDPPESMPVDVYSPDGELLAAGIVPQDWTYALGDHVYALRGDPELDQTVVVRYRLELREQ